MAYRDYGWRGQDWDVEDRPGREGYYGGGSSGGRYAGERGYTEPYYGRGRWEAGYGREGGSFGRPYGGFYYSYGREPGYYGREPGYYGREPGYYGREPGYGGTFGGYGAGWEGGYGGYGRAGDYGVGWEGGYGREGWGGRYGGGYTGEMRRGRLTGRGPKGYRRPDDRIRDEVNERLARHPEIDASEVEVRVENGEVTLTGVVEDRGEKRLAEDLAEDVFGVTDVHNQLKVRHGFLAGLTGEKADEREMARGAEREGRETAATRAGTKTGRTTAP